MEQVKKREVSIWCRLGAYVKLPQDLVQDYFGDDTSRFDELDFNKLFNEGKIEFDGDSYIPEESAELCNQVDGTVHHCPHCGARLKPSVLSGYDWQCLECEEDFVKPELID